MINIEELRNISNDKIIDVDFNNSQQLMTILKSLSIRGYTSCKLKFDNTHNNEYNAEQLINMFKMIGFTVNLIITHSNSYIRLSW